MICVFIVLLTLICGLILPTEGLIRVEKRPDNRLYTAEYTSCMQDSLISFERFDASYYSRNLSIVLDIHGYSNLDANVTFDITVDAYGSQRARFKFDPCNMNLGNACPLTKNSIIETQGVLPISFQDVKMVPNLAWTIPDFEGFVKFRMYRTEDLENSSIDESHPLACIVASLENGHTFQKRVIFALSIVSFSLAIVGFLGFCVIGMEHGIYMLRPVIANSVPSIQHIVDLLQCIVLTAAVGVEQPKVLVSWASNFAWIIGLIPNRQLKNSINSFLKHSGGDLNSQPIGIHRRTVTASNPEDSVVDAYSGLVGLANRFHITSPDFFTLSLIWFVISLGIIGGALIGFMCISQLFLKLRFIRPFSCEYVLKCWKRLLFNALMKWVFICFPILIMFAVFQFTLSDAYGPVILAAILLALLMGLFAWCFLKLAKAVRISRSVTKYPKESINDLNVLSWSGWMHMDLKEHCWYFFIIRFSVVVLSGLLFALLQNYGKVQAIVLFAIEVVAIGFLIGLRPYFGLCSMICALLVSGTRLVSMALLIPMAFNLNTISKVVIGIIIIIVQGLVFSTLTIWGLLNFLSMLVTLWPVIKYQPKWLRQLFQQDEQDSQLDIDDHKLNGKEEDPAVSSLLLENLSFERNKEVPWLHYDNDRPKATEASSTIIPMPMHPSTKSSHSFSDFSEIQRTPPEFYTASSNPFE
ncbi:plasma membrane TRP-like ion channel [Schizosaccharomyces osmophilus]|uniref:Plasma membrane TRP-like ion channel n=1 Tax=Schizosaccharomyces osmophilus TaxID=2545709 RepID=A0AAE9WDB7_9SCHI|nr:plasma membrane TRP-like ion channel [Schizosaccharomyces osmophilus]WBW73479.1 plasma membrane TRP-like ion channel [Schizosaccharomyces osmophilus]